MFTAIKAFVYLLMIQVFLLYAAIYSCIFYFSIIEEISQSLHKRDLHTLSANPFNTAQIAIFPLKIEILGVFLFKKLPKIGN